MKIRDDIRQFGALLNRHGYISGQLELTTLCYQRCFMCEKWRTNKHESVTCSTVLAFMGELNKMPSFRHLSLTGGDPQAWDPLDEMLTCTQGRLHYALRITTTLMKDVPDPALWKSTIREVRLSFDAVDTDVYQDIRGVEVDTNDIVARLVALDHPRVYVSSTVCAQNVDQIPKIIKLFEPVAGVRKVSFLPVVGDRIDHDPNFWTRYLEYASQYTDHTLTSFAKDDPVAARQFCVDGAQGIRCYNEKCGFHVKVNGDVYPCCLTGGEGLPTVPEFLRGNAWSGMPEAPLYAQLRYQNSYCKNYCQSKQIQVNVAGTDAMDSILTLP